MTKVLVVDDKQLVRDSMTATLSRAGFTPVAAADAQAALDLLPRQRPAAVVTDLKMPGIDGLELLGRIRQIDPQLPVVVVTAYASIDTAVTAIRNGAFDYLQKPFEGDRLVVTARRAVEHYALAKENAALKQNDATADPQWQFVGESPVMQAVSKQIEKIANTNGTVLVTGESGTGKEVVARMIHALSARRDRVMLCLNCAALSTSLLESELFGHEKGAFTGADQMRKGRFELADASTLLLDEISEISPQIQAKLLRVLQEHQFERVGSSLTMNVDARIIATSNRDLAQSVADGHFRQDLYYRLNVLPIHLPPLRERRDDIPLLAARALNRQAQRDGTTPRRFDAQTLALLCDYPWPGNVRELENICERAGVLATEDAIAPDLIRPWLAAPDMAPHTQPAADATSLEEIERDVIVKTLGRFNGHRQQTAHALGIGVRTLGLKLKKWKEANLVAETI